MSDVDERVAEIKCRTFFLRGMLDTVGGQGNRGDDGGVPEGANVVDGY